MRVAVIDIGSNSTKLIIGERVGNEIRVLESLKNIIGIGKDTFYKERISREIFNEIIKVLEKYKALIGQYEVEQTRVIATTAVREAENRDIFIDTIKRKTGFDIEVLNMGDAVYFIDAFLSFKLNMKYPINEKNLLIIELGAGGLDVSIMEKGYTLDNFDIPLGTLRLKQFKNCIEATQKETYEALEEYVENEISTLKKRMPDIKLDDILLIDESYSSILTRILPNKNREKNFFSFQRRESRQLLSVLTGRHFDTFAKKFNIPDDIYDTFDGFAIIISKLFKLINKKSFYILETSLSEALMSNTLLGLDVAEKFNKTNQLISVAKNICRKFGSDIKDTKHVAFLSEELFKNLRDVLGLEDKDLLYLQLAAYLHNVGLFINNRAYHKHTEYIISVLSLFRLTPRELKSIACIARYHRKAHPQKAHFLYNSLPLDQQLLVQKLASLLRMADALDSSHKQKVKKLEVELHKTGSLTLVAHVKENFALEKVVLSTRQQLFEEISGISVHLKTAQLK